MRVFRNGQSYCFAMRMGTAVRIVPFAAFLVVDDPQVPSEHSQQFIWFKVMRNRAGCFTNWGLQRMPESRGGARIFSGVNFRIKHAGRNRRSGDPGQHGQAFFTVDVIEGRGGDDNVQHLRRIGIGCDVLNDYRHAIGHTEPPRFFRHMP